MTRAVRVAVFASFLLLLSTAATSAAPAARPPQSRPAPEVPAELGRLLRALRDTTFLTRMQAVNGISEVKGAGDVGARAVAEVALHDRREEIRMSAAWQLSRFPDSGPAILAVLAPAVASSDSTLRANAAEPLGHVAEISAGALPLLLPLTRDPQPTVRAAAGEGLKSVMRVWPEQIPALVEAFSACGPELRFDVGEAIIPAGVAAVPPMLERLSSPDWNERANAARVLGGIGETDGAVAAALAARIADPDFRVRQYALRALESLGTPAAHDALVRYNGGVETHGPVLKTLELHGHAEKPDSTILVVAATYREYRRPLAVPRVGSPPPDVTIAEEHRLYWCDFERGTVRLLARVEVPDEMRAGFTVAMEGWRAGTLAVGTYGMPAKHRYSPDYHSEARYYAVDPDGQFHRLAARPGGPDYVPRYRDLPSGVRQFWDITVREDRIMKSVDEGPYLPIFHVDPGTAELLPGPP